jgi:hypothetical protein
LTAAGAGPDISAYAVRLVGVWQGFVYGGVVTSTPIITDLCNEFAGALDRRAPGAGRGKS